MKKFLNLVLISVITSSCGSAQTGLDTINLKDSYLRQARFSVSYEAYRSLCSEINGLRSTYIIDSVNLTSNLKLEEGFVDGEMTCWESQNSSSSQLGSILIAKMELIHLGVNSANVLYSFSIRNVKEEMLIRQFELAIFLFDYGDKREIKYKIRIIEP